VRRDQARRFNSALGGGGGGGGAASRGGGADVADVTLSATDILVATDAIGMGLNLAIRRIIFSTMTKFDGKSRRPLSISEVKQIGGRAGR
jgi:hypothetical protein